MKNIEHKKLAMRRKSSVNKMRDEMEADTADSSVTLYNKESDRPITFEDFKIIRLIGKGTFGKVYLV